MTYIEIAGRFSEACAGCDLNGQIVRNGNWEPIARALRHFKDEKSAQIESVAEHGSTAILKITPATVDPKTVLTGKSAANRPAFYLIVK